MARHPNLPPGVRYTNAFVLAAEFEAATPRIGARFVAITRHYTTLLEARIKARVAGRPGPRKITGDYQRSWTSQVHVGAGVVEGTVGTDKPQARRLEFGFVGQDRLGREYDQPPYPHAGPAFDETAPEYQAAIAGAVDV